ncbi:hypothetical protein C8R43DRAFT_1134394 [Mycena crocata]|nr:hypothetical protein C8R43DRAFT_1134394 [Mycena crocata]
MSAVTLGTSNAQPVATSHHLENETQLHDLLPANPALGMPHTQRSLRVCALRSRRPGVPTLPPTPPPALTSGLTTQRSCRPSSSPPAATPPSARLRHAYGGSHAASNMLPNTQTSSLHKLCATTAPRPSLALSSALRPRRTQHKNSTTSITASSVSTTYKHKSCVHQRPVSKSQHSTYLRRGDLLGRPYAGGTALRTLEGIGERRLFDVKNSESPARD